MDNHHDNLICKIFLKKNGTVNGRKIERIYNYDNIKKYLDNRYNDSESYKETIRRIQYKIEIRPICKECGAKVKYTGLKNKIFQDFCSQECERKSKITQERIQKTCLERYGVTNGGGSKEALEKIKKTCQEKYGVDNVFYLKEVQYKKKQSTLKHYGVEFNFSAPEVREKIKETCLERYGVTNGGGSKEALEKIKKTCQEKYGVDNIFYLNKYHSAEVHKKRYETMLRNHTFNTSKPEEELFNYIKYKFPLVKRQYNKDIRYPWRCDFYIPEFDCFIEYNGFQSHGPHAYDKNSKEDQLLVEKWKEKYNNGEHPLYKRMIEGWTIYDVKKRKTAKENNLNFYEFWNLNDAKKFIDSL